MNLKVFLLCIVVSLSCLNPSNAEIRIISSDTIVKKKKKIPLITPLLFYTPETKIGTGLAYLGYFHFSKKDSSYRHSVIVPEFVYTQYKQAYSEIPFNLFLIKENYYIYGMLGFFNYPYKFYGIGNGFENHKGELYNAKNYTLILNAMKRFFKKTYLGFRYSINNYNVNKIQKNGLLDTYKFQGINGGVSNGIGIVVLYDSRNTIFSTTLGSYVETSYLVYNHIIGSHYNFNNFTIDARKFHRIYKGNIIAIQGYVNLIEGNAPFYNLSLLGGDKRLRGYYLGRYRDKDFFSTQVEYRSPFYKNRLGAAVFTGMGQVFNEVSNIRAKNIRPAYGMGVRVKFDRKENLSFRIDMALGHKSNGYYFVFNEAF